MSKTSASYRSREGKQKSKRRESIKKVKDKEKKKNNIPGPAKFYLYLSSRRRETNRLVFSARIAAQWKGK